MTIEQIKAAEDAFTANFVAEHNIDETTELSEALNVAYTDGKAGVLETVNPNNNYPPTVKPH